jgi:hypothetical protein
MTQKIKHNNKMSHEQNKEKLWDCSMTVMTKINMIMDIITVFLNIKDLFIIRKIQVVRVKQA